MGKLDGRVFAFTVGSAIVAGRTTGNINFTTDPLDTTTADSAGYKEAIGGEKGGSFTLGGLTDFTATEGVSEAIGYLKAGTVLTDCKWGQTTAGGTFYQFDALITGVSITGDKNSISNYSITGQVVGEWTEETVSGS